MEKDVRFRPATRPGGPGPLTGRAKGKGAPVPLPATRGALLLLFVLALWGLAGQGPTAEIAGSPPQQAGPTQSMPDHDPGESRAEEPRSADPAEVQDEVQPPGREDPDRFYRKPPRKPRELRQVNA